MASKRKRKAKETAARGPPGKRARLHSQKHHVNENIQNRSQPSGSTQHDSKKLQKTSAKAIVPFEKDDDVLLVGEGDFSFAFSLVKHHKHQFKSLIATTYESREELLSKHPQAEKTILEMQAAGSNGHESSPESTHDITDSENDSTTGEEHSNDNKHEIQLDVLYNIDATRLTAYPAIRKRNPPCNKIMFNFPHVGGRSTDVNRQVRHNQALVHGYFASCVKLLSGSASSSSRPRDPSILVTLFEGEPYTLWNVRDLARSVGLLVKRSWVFDASLYPGYRHARTLGNLREPTQAEDGGGAEDEDQCSLSRNGDEDAYTKSHVGKEGEKKKGRWRGEERRARTYEFGLPERAPKPNQAGQPKKRRDKRKQVATKGGGDPTATDDEDDDDNEKR